MLLRPEDKDAVGNIFLVYRDNYILVFKIANMGKYIFKRYYIMVDYSGNNNINTYECGSRI